MDVFAGVVIACLVAVAAIGGAWLRQKKSGVGDTVAAGLVFTAKSACALVLLAVALNGYAATVGWQAVSAAAFVATTPLIFALAVLMERRGRAA